MPIDPSIPLQAQPPPQLDVFGSLGNILALRGLQRREQKEARELAKEQQFEALAQQYGDDPEAFITQVSKIDPMIGAKYREQYQKGRKEQFSAYGAQLDSETKELETATRELQAIAPGDVQSYAGWRGKWTARNPQLNQIVPPPEQFTPDVQARLLTLGDSTTNFLKGKAEGVKAFMAGDYRKGLGNALAVAPSFELAKQTIEEARKAIPKGAQGDLALFESFLEQADGDLATFQALAGNAALTEKERVEIQQKAVDDLRADTAEARQAARDAQQAKVEGARLGIEGARLGLERQRVGLEAQRVKQAGEASKTGPGGKAGPDVGRIMNEIESLSSKINTETGTSANVAGWIRRGKAAANLDNDVSEYNSLVNGMIPMVARAVGHTGVLTQQDVDSVRALFPKVGDNATLAKNKMTRVKSLIQNLQPVSSTVPPVPSEAPASAQKKNPFRK